MSNEYLPFPTPALTDHNDGTTRYVLGTKWDVTQVRSWVGVRWRVPDSLSGDNHYILAYEATGGTFLQSKAITPTPGGDQIFLFDSPISPTAGAPYVAAVLTNHYTATTAGQGWVWPFDDGHGLVGYEGRFFENTPADTENYPFNSSTSTYHVSPVLTLADAVSVDLGRSTETNTIRTLTAAKAVALGRAVETATVRTVAASKTVRLGRIAETSTMRPLVVGDGTVPVGANTPIVSQTSSRTFVWRTREVYL